MSKLEQEALDLSMDRKRLKTRLLEAKSVLIKRLRQRFRKPKLDFENKRLISDDEKLVLQWQLRPHPDQPVFSKNQQTNRGEVIIKPAAWVDTH